MFNAASSMVMELAKNSAWELQKGCKGQERTTMGVFPGMVWNNFHHCNSPSLILPTLILKQNTFNVTLFKANLATPRDTNLTYLGSQDVLRVSQPLSTLPDILVLLPQFDPSLG